MSKAWPKTGNYSANTLELLQFCDGSRYLVLVRQNIAIRCDNSGNDTITGQIMTASNICWNHSNNREIQQCIVYFMKCVRIIYAFHFTYMYIDIMPVCECSCQILHIVNTMKRGQYYDCWCPGDYCHQGINSRNIDLITVLPNHPSGHPRWVKSKFGRVKNLVIIYNLF